VLLRRNIPDPERTPVLVRELALKAGADVVLICHTMEVQRAATGDRRRRDFRANCRRSGCEKRPGRLRRLV